MDGFQVHDQLLLLLAYSINRILIHYIILVYSIFRYSFKRNGFGLVILSSHVTVGAEPLWAGPALRSKRVDQYFYNGSIVSGRSVHIVQYIWLRFCQK